VDDRSHRDLPGGERVSLGFSWRDPHPSGAASVRWYHDYLARPDPARKQRILDYNEDDCRAMRVLLDALRLISRNPIRTP
jgi:predicted RecB family nuclease